MARLLVIALLSGPAGEMADALRRVLDPKTAAQIGAHVTLAGPAETAATAAEVGATLARVAAELPAFTVTVGGVRTFLPVSPVCYLAIEPQARLRAAHDLLVARLGWQEHFPYMPHVTMTEYLPEEDTERIRRELEARDLHASDRVDTLTLLEQAPDGAWLTRGEYPLPEPDTPSPPPPG